MVDTKQVLTEALQTIHWREPYPEVADRVIAYLAERNVMLIEDDGKHYVNFRVGSGDQWDWTIMHPAPCRPNLHDCELNELLLPLIDALRHSDLAGRWELREEDGEAVISR